jgi:hypothetical protein
MIKEHEATGFRLYIYVCRETERDREKQREGRGERDWSTTT